VAVRPAIVALISKAAPTQPGTPAPLFPPIIGTGFFVDRRGIVATNRHVVQCLEGLPKHPATGKASAAAVVFLERQEGNGTVMGCLVVDVENYWTLENFEASSRWYGEGLPDLAFVKLRATATPALPLDDRPGTLRVGAGIATAGFPMGSDLITLHGKITQLTPMLRKGIISSVFPFQSALPHGFTIDAMVQPGASGSPVFLEDEPRVIGMVSAVLRDTATAALASEEPRFCGTLSIPLSTNISLALPSHVIAWALKDLEMAGRITDEGMPTLLSLVPSNPQQHQEPSWERFARPG
jgi:hypothetical protein